MEEETRWNIIGVPTMTTKHGKRGNDMWLLLIVKKELWGRHVEVTLSTHESWWIGDARHALL